VITLDQAVNWLNWETPTELYHRNEHLIHEMRTAPQSRTEKIYQYFMDYLYSHSTPADEVEIRIYCGVYLYEHARIAEAVDQLNEALTLLSDANKQDQKNKGDGAGSNGKKEEYKEKDYHRLALTDWLMYTILCPQGDPDQAFDWLRKALRNLNERACFYHRLGDATRENWYRDRMIDTAHEIIATLRSAYGCIFEFDGSGLCPSACLAKERIMEDITQGRFDDAALEIAFLKEVTHRSPEYREVAEVFTISGLVTAEKGDAAQAIHEFRSALAHCQPASHEQVFIRWMLALFQLTQPSQRGNAIQNMEICIRQIDALATAVDHQNHLYKRIWYEVHREAMKSLLQEKTGISGTAAGYTPDPDGSDEYKSSRRKKGFVGFPGMK
jgi:tetratricopeptide (TPR) repeat protein